MLYGGKLTISDKLLSELLKVKGSIVGIMHDPLGGRVDIYLAGDKEHYPEVEEGCYASEVMFEIEVGNATGSVLQREILETSIVDPKTNTKYVHYRKEELGDGKEDYKKKEEKENRPVGVNNGFERNFCEKHPQGECPRQKGDCSNCKYRG